MRTAISVLTTMVTYLIAVAASFVLWMDDPTGGATPSARGWLVVVAIFVGAVAVTASIAPERKQ